ncbi:MAG: Stf0 family sulfotransferase [bacterium]|nr:Stf0 family sulfotransferase [bacterium]
MTQSYLAGHPDVALASGEVPDTVFWTAVDGVNGRGETRAGRTESLAAVFDDFAGREVASLAVGNKIALPGLAAARRIVGCLRTHGFGVRLVVVRRRDLVAQLGSLRRAQQTGVWHRAGGGAGGPGAGGGDEANASEHRVVTISDAELESYVRETVASHRLMASVVPAADLLELDYEDDVATGRLWPRVCDFLGLPVVEPEWVRMRKVSPPAGRYIVDYDRHAGRLAELERAAASSSLPAPELWPEETRSFLMRRARMRRTKDPHGALADALDAIAAPAEFAIPTAEGPCGLARAVLEEIGDPTLADRAIAHLDRCCDPGDLHVGGLRRVLARALGRDS